NRVQGHMLIKDALAIREDGRPGMIFFSSAQETIGDLMAIQADEADPDDCAKEPHERTHTVDSVRYFCVSRVIPADPGDLKEAPEFSDGSYDAFMRGGETPEDYFSFGEVNGLWK
ncbi:MAG: hypothetical protein IIT84_03835, partial [Oscillospiraceae bacterium]|nr:hypothetical protein [Oscillospiraceae bacterium]